ncbi:MAG: insulinase family protein [Alphaproteobacteria bacterium]|nr:insulinase family protein [Alphaproteobacteria bacterium]
MTLLSIGRRPAVAALVLLLSAALLAIPAGAAVFNPDSFTLDNGMEVVIVSNHRAPVVTHMVWYRAGAMDEPPGRTGVAHLLEHLMFKGTAAFPDGAFSQIVARNGGSENAFTSQDFTGYFQSVAADRLALMMEMESDRMTNLILSQEDIDTERQVVLEERRSRIDNDPGSRLGEQANAAMYMNHPYRNPVIGWEHEIRALTRDDLMQFYRDWYAPNNAILVVVGDVTVDQVRPLAEKYYGRIPARQLAHRIDWREPPAEAAQLVTLADPQVRQPSWSRRYHAPGHVYGATEHAYALEVLADILGGGPTSRIYRSVVVEQKIAAAAGAWYSPSSRGPTSFGFYGSPLPGGDLAPVQAAMEAEIEKLLRDGVTEDEVARAKARLQAEAIYARDSLRAPAQSLGGGLVVGMTVEEIEAWPERIGAVTVAAVNAAARSVLGNEAPVTTMLIPAKRGDGS